MLLKYTAALRFHVVRMHKFPSTQLMSAVYLVG